MVLKPDISVIIPCFNTPAAFINEAVESVKQYSNSYVYEIIIVDDGSVNAETINYLDNINDPAIKVFIQENKGAAAARNTGFKNSSGNYILFLDSDDRILQSYIEKSIKVLSSNSAYGVVYGKARNFGDSSRDGIETQPFDVVKLLINNQVPMCAVIKRQVWESVNGLDENLRQFEDWEFWLSVYKAGWKFFFLNQIVFEYRIQNNSFFSTVDDAYYKKTLAYIYKKHWDLVHEIYYSLYAKSLVYENDMRRPVRSFFKYLKKKFVA